MTRPPLSHGYLETLLDASRLGLPAAQVDRIVRAAALHGVPGAGPCVAGLLDLAGELVTVYDTRVLLDLPRRPLRATDRIVIASAPRRCGLLVDDVLGLLAQPPAPPPDSFTLQAAGLRGIARCEGGVLLVQDLRRLLAFDQAIPVAHA